MTNNTILVTGGAGYIGSHTARQLREAGEKIVVLDNLSTGFRSAVLDAELVVGDTGDRELIDRIIADHNVDTIMHFAAHTIVPESVAHPLKYYGNNTCASRNLIERAVAGGVRHFVFSSTAAVYGIPDGGVCHENSPTVPINPYGLSKLMTEWMLRDVTAASELASVALRYFNVAGSDPDCRIGQSTPEATLLIKVASEAAVGKRDKLFIYGTDYDTADGTAIRDYIHVEDIARAHIDALEYLRRGGESTTLNCGYGHGFSVREVLAMVEKVNGASLPIEEAGRRAGDPPALIAECDRIKSMLGWKPRYDDLEKIVDSSLKWERYLQDHPAS